MSGKYKVKHCTNKITIIAVSWVAVLARPQLFAAIIFPVFTASKRIDVTKNSRSKIIITGTEPIKFSSTKQISVDITNILSANGSKNLPKFVICPHFLASFPSKWSVNDAIRKIIKVRKNL